MADKKNKKRGFLSYGGFDTDYSGSNEFEAESGSGTPVQPLSRKELKQLQKARRRKILIAVLAVILFCLLISRTPLFGISEIIVRDNIMFTDEEIIAASGMSPGDNIFRMSKRKIRKTVMQNNPYMVDVKVDRKLPDVLVMTVVENDPVLALPCGEEFLILDKDGLAVEMRDSQLTATLLTGMEVKSYSVGTAPDVSDKQSLKLILRMVNDVNEAGVFFRQVDIPNPLAIQAYVTETLSCYGTPEAIRENVEGLKALLYDLSLKGYPNGVIYMGDDGYATFSPS